MAATFNLGDARLNITGNVSNLNKALGQAQANTKRTVGNIQASMSNMGRKMTMAGAAITGAVAASVKSFMDSGDQIHKMAIRTGFASDTLQVFARQAELSGTSLGQVEKGITALQRRMIKAGEGSKSYALALKQLNLNYEDLKELSPEQQFRVVTEALRGVEDSTMRNKIAMELFSRTTGTKLIPLIESGSKGFNELNKEMRANNEIMSEEQVQAAADLTDMMTELKGALSVVARDIATALVPTLKELFPRIRETALQVAGWIRENQGAVMTITKIGAALVVLGPVLIGAAGALGTVVQAVNLLKLAIGTSPVGLTLMASVAGIAALFETFNNPTGFDNFLTRLIDKIPVVGKLIDWWYDKIIAVIDGVKEAIRWTKNLIGLGEEAPRLGTAEERARQAREHGLPQFATGTNFHRGGPAIVGEKGPEIVNMPRGSQVFDNKDTQGIIGALKNAGQKTINFSPVMKFSGPITEADADHMLEMMHEKIERDA